MNKIKSFALAAISAVAVMGFSSCNTSDSPSEPVFVVDLNSADIPFNVNNYWSDCYTAADLTVTPFVFSHRSWTDEWDGVSYPAWNGFCPSRVNDNREFASDWTEHQWACIPQNPNNGLYLVGNSESVVSENPVDNNKCSIRMSSNGLFNPKFAYVTNSSYTYYCAKNGSAFNEAFTYDDNFVLHVVGVRMGTMTGHLQYPLIYNGQYLDQWGFITLEQLGTVDEVLFYVDSTKKNSYGLTVPAYFCLTDFVYNLPQAANS